MTTTKPTADQNLHFMAWRATALQLMPYMSDVIFGFRPVACDEVDTFAVDPGLRLYVNFENTIEKGARFNAEALLHESSHIFGEHNMLAQLAGVQDHERMAWNLAGDFAINDDLRDAGCHLLAAHGVFASSIGQPDYQTPIHYMGALRKLMKNAKPKPGNGSPSDGKGQPGQGGPGAQGTPVPAKGCGSGAGGERGAYELPEGGLGDDTAAASQAEKDLIRISTASNIRKHQEQHGIGSVPGGLAQIVADLEEESTTPWERQLGAFMRRALAVTAGNFDLSYQRRNRRRLNEELRDRQGNIVGRIIAPGYIKPVPTVHFYRDTSGSVSGDDLALATGEVIGISKRLGIRGNELVVTDVDTRVYESRKFTGKESIRKVTGRGGTDMCKAIEHSCEKTRRPSVIVIATDGATGWPAERPPVPVVVLLINASQRDKNDVPEWARVVEVTSK
jgi:predicted metal-dependent peptidase